MNIPRGYNACNAAWRNEINTAASKNKLEMSQVEKRDMIWNGKKRFERKVARRKKKTHIKSNLWSINPVVCGLGLVREIDLIPWAWTPSIFCLQSIFMNPRGFSRIKHINNQCVRGWRSPNHCIQSERPPLGAAQTQCIVGGKRSAIRDDGVEFGGTLTVRKRVHIEMEIQIFVTEEVNDAGKGLGRSLGDLYYFGWFYSLHRAFVMLFQNNGTLRLYWKYSALRWNAVFIRFGASYWIVIIKHMHYLVFF